LDLYTSQAPAALKDRVRDYAMVCQSPSLQGGLAEAAQAALAQALSHPADRTAALDLLAADALITLALLAQSQEAPEHLEEFATEVLRSTRPPA
jgi:hypothetical protein